MGRGAGSSPKYARCSTCDYGLVCMYRLLFAIDFGMLSEVAHMYPACWSARGPWPCWGYARAVISLADRSSWDRKSPQILGAYYFRSMLSIYRELLWIALGRPIRPLQPHLLAHRTPFCV